MYVILMGAIVSAALAFCVRFSLPFGFAPLWQSVQYDARIGAICVSKSGGAPTAGAASSRTAAKESVRGME